MEIFSLADALGRCKKRLCPPRCAAQCQPDPAETGSLCNHPPASPTATTTATTPTSVPVSRRGQLGPPCRHRCRETESPAKATPRSRLHLPWPRPRVMMAHLGCSNPPLGPASPPRSLLWLSPIAFSLRRLVAHSTYPIDYMMYRGPPALPQCWHGPSKAINLSQALQPVPRTGGALLASGSGMGHPSRRWVMPAQG